MFFFQELLSHLGSQQTQIDSLNRLGKQIQESGNNQDIVQKVQEKLDIMNGNWKILQQQTLYKDQEEDADIIQDEYKIPNNGPLFHFSLTPTRGSPDSDGISEDHYKYQVTYSELFDWLLSCEESLRRPSPVFVNADIIKSRLAGLQVCPSSFLFFIIKIM